MTARRVATALRSIDGARYELTDDGNWYPMDYHCVDCADDDMVQAEDFGEHTALSVRVEPGDEVTK